MQNLFLSLSHGKTKLKTSFLAVDFFQGVMSYYAVAKGRSPGIYQTWDECKAQVHKFPGPVYKKFSTKKEAEDFVKQRGGVLSNFTKAPAINGSSLVVKAKKSYGSPAVKTSKRLLSSLSESDNESSVLNQQTKKFKSSEPSTSSEKNQFIVDKDGFAEVYTDGACSFNGRGSNAKAGIGVWFSDNNPYNVSQAVIGRATNNMAEIQAVTVAATQAQKAGIKKLKINTDSQFLISCITQWMPNWKKRGWQTATGKPVVNKIELIEMEKALAPLKVSWNHVRGHVGIYGNEMADKLAREGSENYKKT